MVVPGNVTTAMVTLFKPSSRNFVQILVFNDMYNGPASDEIEFSTPEGSESLHSSFMVSLLGQVLTKVIA